MGGRPTTNGISGSSRSQAGASCSRSETLTETATTNAAMATEAMAFISATAAEAEEVRHAQGSETLGFRPTTPEPAKRLAPSSAVAGLARTTQASSMLVTAPPATSTASVRPFKRQRRKAGATASHARTQNSTTACRLRIATRAAKEGQTALACLAFASVSPSG